eukprot:gnl/TRDRNA2_/TRDRNA2_187631_c0_seq1.p1 gnl/TRDRNA2_/TRDRNA2_187631_c0~~gnl/TRDRNA2_/TRDRNA2_187631_c0_seq1.p1  ORF type:complete len:435 (-),score=67.29 gnl/TRDRNA2_/TRDRNA2_187631_c0_seq1:44-1348(-)
MFARRFLIRSGLSSCRTVSTLRGGSALHLAMLSRPRLPTATRLQLGLALGGASAALLTAAPVIARADDDLSHELSGEEQRTVALFQRCSKSAVHINTSVMQQQGSIFHMELQEIPKGSGSGFAWDEQHIVTNFHVIQGADKAVVTLSDNTTLEASIVGVEPDCDIAVLKLEQPRGAGRVSLDALDRNTSGKLRVGQRVLAIGNPFGLDQTLTSGIVSGLGREMKGVSGRKIRGLIQTDAAINPGNSGGPLLDARGRLIGVNTMIASPSGAFAGVGFAIPVDTVVRVVNQLLQHGHVRHPYLGLFLTPDHVKESLSRQLPGGLHGALVMSTAQDSPAERAGLRPTTRTSRGIILGDEITAIDGKKVTTTESLLDVIEGCDIGDEVRVTYKRHSEANARVLQATVKLGERPEQDLQRGMMRRSSGIPVGPTPRSRM